MNALAELKNVEMFGKTCYQVNLINPQTGLYYNGSSRVFESVNGALDYINGLKCEIKSSCIKLWGVFRLEYSWEYSKQLDMFVWVRKSLGRVTPYRIDMEAANIDFKELGFEPNDSPDTVQCHDSIMPKLFWLRYIVQIENF